MAMFHIVSDTITLRTVNAVSFDLPAASSEGRAAFKAASNSAMPLAVVLRTPSGTQVFFDDTPYRLAVRTEKDALGEQFSRAAITVDGKLMVLADRGVTCGEILELADLARDHGFTRIIFAERRDGEAEIDK